MRGITINILWGAAALLGLLVATLSLITIYAAIKAAKETGLFNKTTKTTIYKGRREP